MKNPTDTEIMRALCCGEKCKLGPNTGYCHAFDFVEETRRIRALLERTASSRAVKLQQEKATGDTRHG
jgi:hypothetical protein